MGVPLSLLLSLLLGAADVTQSTSTMGHAVQRQAPSSVSHRHPTAGQTSADEHRRHRHHQTNVIVPVISELSAPVNVDERLRHSSSTSAASASTSGRGTATTVPPDQPQLAASTAAATSVQRRRRLSRQHSTELREVPPDVEQSQRQLRLSPDTAAETLQGRGLLLDVVAESQLSSTPSASKMVVVAGKDRLNTSPATTTNHHADVIGQSRRSNVPATSAAAQLTPVEYHRTLSLERDVTPVLFSRDFGSATQSQQQQSYHSRSLDANHGRSTVRERPAASTLDDTGTTSRHSGDDDDVDRHLSHVPRRLRRRRGFQSSDAPTSAVDVVDPRMGSSTENADASLSMPSIVHYNTAAAQAQYQPAAAARRRQLPSTPPPVETERPVSAVYVMSDGVRRRLVPAAGTEYLSAPVYDEPPSTELAELAEPPRRYRLEPAPAAAGTQASVMNMAAGARGDQRLAVWRREDVAVLSELRRDEIRRQKELDEQQTLVLRLGDFKV